MPVTYQEAGVSVEAGYEAVRRMKAYAEATFDGNVLQSLGSFGGMYALGEQVLVSGTDGVGTKLKAAFAAGAARHRGHRLRGDVRQRRGLPRSKTSLFPRLYRNRQARA
jgi:phosphoribosylaminoimidazole (AIR) synthetase